MIYDRQRTDIYIHKFCSGNKAAISASDQCGCFYCREIFPASEVTEWTWMRREDPPTTALCPRCGIDSVLPDKQVELSEAMLQEMSERWFSVAHSIRLRIAKD